MDPDDFALDVGFEFYVVLDQWSKSFNGKSEVVKPLFTDEFCINSFAHDMLIGENDMQIIAVNMFIFFVDEVKPLDTR